MLYLDQYYSSTLGCPLSVSGFGDCSPPEPLTSYRLEHCLLRFVYGYIVLTTEILRSDNLINPKIEAYSEKLLRHLKTLPPNMQFNESWLDSATETPSWPLDIQAADYYIKTHTYVILLNRQWQQRRNNEMAQQAERDDTYHVEGAIKTESTAGFGYMSAPEGEISMPCDHLQRGYQRIVESCVAVSVAFRFLFDRNKPCLIDWTLCQSGFNAAYVLGIYMHESQDYSIMDIVLASYRIFEDLSGRHSEPSNDRTAGRTSLLHMACERLASLLKGHFDTVGPRQAPYHDREEVMRRDGMVLLEDPGLTSAGQDAPFYLPLNWNLDAVPSGDLGMTSAISNQEIWHFNERHSQDQVMNDAETAFDPRSSQAASRAAILTSNNVAANYTNLANMPGSSDAPDITSSVTQYADEIDAFLSQMPISRPPTFRSHSSGQQSFTSLSGSTNATSIEKSPEQLWASQNPSHVQSPVVFPDAATALHERAYPSKSRTLHQSNFYSHAKGVSNPMSNHVPHSLQTLASDVATKPATILPSQIPTQTQHHQRPGPSMEHISQSRNGVHMEFGASQNSNVHSSSLASGFGWPNGQY